MALHAVSIGLQQRLITEVAALQQTMTLRVAPPLCPVSVSPTDFGHADELMSAARASTRRWLDRPAPTATDQTHVLGLHTHRHEGLSGRGEAAADEGRQLAAGGR
jgi:NTE family protein